MSLQDFKDNLRITTFGPESTQDLDEVKCINCHLPAIPRCHSEAGMRELSISGICEVCFDKLFDFNEED